MVQVLPFFWLLCLTQLSLSVTSVALAGPKQQKSFDSFTAFRVIIVLNNLDRFLNTLQS